MVASLSQKHIWPQQTGSSASPAAKRRRAAHPPSLQSRGSTSKLARQTVADQNVVANAKKNCEVNSGNDVVSCFPTADTVIPQHQWATFVWNSNLPDFTQTDLVDIYLFHGDSGRRIFLFENVTNPKGQAGAITAPVNDSWWGERGSAWGGTNISYPFYWLISRSDLPLDAGTQKPQTTFTAVQTTFADSVLAAMSSTSVASASSVAAALSASTTGSSSSRSTSTPGVQSGASSSNNFPHWAIAVIVVLGFLAMATTCVLAFFIIRRIRRRNAIDSNRNSMGSNSPMMANTGHSQASPLLASAAVPGRHASTATSHGQGAPSVVSPDGASTISRAGSTGDSGPFSGADAAIMADAFRKALRKPDFADRPVEEGESPENPEATEEVLLNRELADEGKDLRSVGSSRGVKVETMSDAGDTAYDSAH